ncbi:RTA1 like protein [Suillus discolor]|uniref:RTA1 like protein n=1 Tax=Suillus discolor TaxID=1912936 RepID=A0A9P7EZ67_9AGAM|nr:RTA1 like protein [Suillus discolor]KAG2099274.1 RTA1 like protein [Suillus discolor]
MAGILTRYLLEINDCSAVACHSSVTMSFGAVFATTTPITVGPYHYVPTEWICILFLVLYRISTATFAGILEILGWSARLWSSRNPKLLTPYEIQIVGTIIAPTPLVAANFIILGRYSRLTPRLYTIVFCCFDIVCLIVQAVGGASAAHAASTKTSASMGANIMLGGIAAQLSVETLLRLRYNRPFRYVEQRRILEKGPRVVSKNLRLMLCGMAFCTLCIFIRLLADGWDEPVITTERYFDWLDGGMVTLAIYTLNFFYPGILVKKDNPLTHASQQSIDEESSSTKT